jgi:hypothetical protein
MRLRIIASFALLASAIALGQSPGTSSLSQLPDGEISGNAYTNGALGVIFHFPKDWSANLDSGHSVTFGKDPDGPANRCTRILLRWQSPRKVKGWFTAWGVLFAIDPVCLGVDPFPSSVESGNSGQINDFAGKIYALYHPAPFFPPGGVDIFAERAGDETNGPIIVSLRGKGSRNIDEIDPSITRTPVAVNTQFALGQAQEFWVGWAEMDDDRSKSEMERVAKIEIKVK